MVLFKRANSGAKERPRAAPLSAETRTMPPWLRRLSPEQRTPCTRAGGRGNMPGTTSTLQVLCRLGRWLGTQGGGGRRGGGLYPDHAQAAGVGGGGYSKVPGDIGNHHVNSYLSCTIDSPSTAVSGTKHLGVERGRWVGGGMRKGTRIVR